MSDLLLSYREHSFCVRRDDLALAVVRGPDRVRWLNGMVSTDVAKVTHGHGILSLAVGRTGKVLAEIVVLARADELVLAVDAHVRADLVTHLARHLIMDDAEVLAVDGWRVVQVVGKGAHDALEAHRQHGLGEAHSLVDTGAGYDGYLLVNQTDMVADERAHDDAEVERLRIARGLPRFRVDYNEMHYPQEALVEKTHVAFDKGCYLGQEVVCMLELRGHVKRKLALVEIGTAHPLGTPVTSADGTRVGELGSSATSLLNQGKTLAFAMLKRAFTGAGCELRIGETPALVVVPPLPEPAS